MDIVLSDLANLQNEATATAAINSNNTTIENAFAEVLTETGPNVLSSNVDMNGYRITGLPDAVAASEPITKAQYDASDFSAATVAAAAATDAAALANTAAADADAAAAAALAAAGGIIGDGTVTAAKLASDSVTTAKILDANVTAAKIASDAVTTIKILDSNVTTAKIAASSVTNAKLANMVDGTLKGNLSGATAAPSDVTIASLITALTNAGFGAAPVGSVIASAATSVPSGYLECDGSAVSRTTYSALFTAVSTTYGVGDESTTFNLPDLRGYFVRGWDNGRGIDTGRAFGSSQTDSFAAHTHSAPTTYTNFYSGLTVDAYARPVNITIGTTGSTGSTETKPKNVALFYCIKT